MGLLSAKGQGLDGIVAEKYYVSNAADAAGSIGTLPTGSVTWRIYVDLSPGFRLQAVYGVAGHPLVLNTTTTFFNNEDRGSYIPAWTKAQAADNTVMLDSYLTLGSVTTPGTSSEFGVLKTEDNNVGTIVNANGILQNNDPSAGQPLTSRDGFLPGNTPAITFVGINPAGGDLNVFDNTSQVGNAFTTSNGSIASLTGATGPTASNRVLVAQLTTTGIVHYELNLQIINTATGVVSNYVASNPGAGEQTNASLIGNLGVALASEPTTVGAITFGTTTSSSMVVNFTSGNGAKRMLIARATNAVNANPTDAITYTGNSVYGSGSSVGTGNFVVYVGAANTVTVTGLNPSTVYHYRLIEFNDGGLSGGENYNITTAAVANNTTGATGTTYNWNQSGAGPFSWTTASNWTPSRNFPAQDDVLIFATGSTGTTITNVPTQSIARLVVQSNTSISLAANGSSTLTIRGNSAPEDLSVTAGSSLLLNSTSPVNIELNSSVSGVIFGNIELATTNRLTAASTNGVRFKSGSNCTLTANYSGAAFGSTGAVANSILFETGSTYTHNSGDNPFQRTAPSSVVVFSSGSNQIWNSTTGFDATGRTYGNLTIGAVVSAVNTGTLTFGLMTITPTGQFTLTGSGSTAVNIRGGLVNNSPNLCSIGAGSGNINFQNTANQQLNGTGTGTFAFPTVNGGKVIVNLNNNVSTNKSITLDDLVLNGNVTFSAPATWSFNGTITGTGSFGTSSGNYNANLSFLPSALSIGTFKTTPFALNNLTINRIGTSSTLTSQIQVWGTVTMTEGTLVSNGFLRLGSNASRQGIISGVGNGTITGNVIVDRFIPGSGNSPARMLSSAVSGLTTNTAWSDDFPVVGDFPFTYNPNGPFATVYPTIWGYDDNNVAPQSQYESANTVAINPMMGFFTNMQTLGSRATDVVGPVNNGAYSLTLPPTINGIHFVGNPYPSPIRWSLVRTLPGQVGLQSSYYGWSSVNNDWGFFNGTVGTFGLNDTIYLGQGFSVTTSTPAGGNFIMNNTVRHTTNTPTFFRTERPNRILKMNIEGQNGKDQFAVYTIEGGKEEYNPESDAKKVTANPVDREPEISVVVDEIALAIKELSDEDIKREIPVKVSTFESGIYSFTAAEFSNFSGVKVVFTDKALGKNIEVSESFTYRVELNEGTTENRFFLNIGAEETLVSQQSAGIDCFGTEGQLQIFNNESEGFNGFVQLFDLSGKLLFSQNMNIAVGQNSVNIPEVATGVYLAKIIGGKEVATKKVFIK